MSNFPFTFKIKKEKKEKPASMFTEKICFAYKHAVTQKDILNICFKCLLNTLRDQMKDPRVCYFYLNFE